MARTERFGGMNSNKEGKCKTCPRVIKQEQLCFYDNWRKIRICEQCKNKEELKGKTAEGGPVTTTPMYGPEEEGPPTVVLDILREINERLSAGGITPELQPDMVKPLMPWLLAIERLEDQSKKLIDQVSNLQMTVNRLLNNQVPPRGDFNPAPPRTLASVSDIPDDIFASCNDPITEF